MTPRGILLYVIFGSLIAAQDTSSQSKYFEQGEHALSEHRYSEAAEAYQTLVKLSPGTAEVYGRLGLIYFQESKFKQAVPLLQRALTLKPNLPNTDILLAMCLSELGQYERALPGLEKGFRSSDAAVRRMSGLQLLRAYTGLQQDANAVALALELNRAFPNDSEILYHSSKVYANFSYLKLKQLADVAPDSIWRHQAAGEVYESAGNLDLAIAEYRQVLAQSPDRHGIHYRIGKVLVSRSSTVDSGSQLEALSEFQQELTLDPTNANAAYEAGEIYRKSGRLEQSRDWFAKALQSYPDFEEAQLGLAGVLIALGQPAMAIPHLQRAIAIRPEDEVSYYRLALAYRALGSTEQEHNAVGQYRIARSKRATQSFQADNLQHTDVTPQGIDVPIPK